MNTSEVSKLLGVSSSTILRWITQLKLDIDKTANGHYRFSDEDISLLQQIQEQLQNGTSLQNIEMGEKKVRKATITTKQVLPNEHTIVEKLQEKVTQIEKRLDTKADDVVSYQLLQHRSDIEELQKTVQQLTKHLETLEAKMQPDYYLAFNETATTEKQKKKPFFKTFFGSSN
jgi:chromosome-anchoring protein RacA